MSAASARGLPTSCDSTCPISMLRARKRGKAPERECRGVNRWWTTFRELHFRQSHARRGIIVIHFKTPQLKRVEMHVSKELCNFGLSITFFKKRFNPQPLIVLHRYSGSLRDRFQTFCNGKTCRLTRTGGSGKI